MTGTTLDVILIAALVAASVPTHGLAQEPDSVVADTVPLYRLDGVTVTVTRTREEINRLPYAVGVLGAAEIRRFDATISLAESLVQIPGLFANNRYNFALGDRISIRGFGARSQFGVRGIRVIQDGIPLTFADGQSQLNNLDLSAAGRIEVIRGPSSALYGNASGGVISVQTEPAPPVGFGPDLGILFGSFADSDTYQKLDLSAAGQSGALDYTSHLSFFRTDGFRTHSSAKYGLFNTRLRYQLDPRSELTAVINYQNTPEAQNSSSLTDSVAAVKPDTARDIVLPPADCPPDPGFAGCQDLGEEYDQGQLGILYTRRLAQAHQFSLAGYGIKRGVDSRIPFTFIQLDRLAGGLHAKYRFAPASHHFSGLTAGVDMDALADDRLENDLDSLD